MNNIEVINSFNTIKDKYRNLYFDLFTTLLMLNWRPLDDYISSSSYDFLVSSELYDRYINDVSTTYSEVVESFDTIQSFEVDFYNGKVIEPPEDFISSIKDFSNADDKSIAQYVINKYYEDIKYYKIELDNLFKNNNWTQLFIKEVDNFINELVDEVEVYVSPFMMSNLDEFNTINKDNVLSLLESSPNLIVDVNLWWNYKVIVK